MLQNFIIKGGYDDLPTLVIAIEESLGQFRVHSMENGKEEYCGEHCGLLVCELSCTILKDFQVVFHIFNIYLYTRESLPLVV